MFKIIPNILKIIRGKSAIKSTENSRLSGPEMFSCNQCFWCRYDRDYLTIITHQSVKSVKECHGIANTLWMKIDLRFELQIGLIAVMVIIIVCRAETCRWSQEK